MKVQPMSLPAGLIFYLDYTYGVDEEKRKLEKAGVKIIYGWKEKKE